MRDLETSGDNDSSGIVSAGDTALGGELDAMMHFAIISRLCFFLLGIPKFVQE